MNKYLILSTLAALTISQSALGYYPDSNNYSGGNYYYGGYQRVSYHQQKYRHSSQRYSYVPLANRQHLSSRQASGPYYGRQLCDSPSYYCVKVYPGDTWGRLFPGSDAQDLVMRLNRTNLSMQARRWIVVPKNLHGDYLSYSPLPTKSENHGNKRIVISLSKNAFGAYDGNGSLVHWGPISSKADSPRGHFKIFSKGGADCISKKYPEPYGGARMPYCMHYHGGFAIHGQVLPGYHHSHGCMRIFTTDAKWLNLDFAHVGTEVFVTN